MLQLNAVQLATAIKTSVNLDKPLFTWGSPGIGKSDTIAQVAADLDAQVIDIRLSMWDTVDFRGIPSIVGGRTVWNPPIVMPVEGTHSIYDPNRLIILSFDEMMQGLPAVQSVAFQAVLERRTGEHKFTPNVRVVAASNRMTDRAGANRMATPLANRFMHCELIAQLDPWCSWAWGKDLNPLVIAFLRLRPELLNTFDPAKGDVAFGTPRSWATVCEIVAAKLPTDIRYALIAGTVGEGPAAELEAFMRVWESMPNIDGILLDPAGATVPQEPGVLFAVSAALAQRANKGNFANVCAYADRLPQAYAMRTVKDAVKRCPDVQTTKAFNRFAVDHSDMWKD